MEEVLAKRFLIGFLSRDQKARQAAIHAFQVGIIDRNEILYLPLTYSFIGLFAQAKIYKTHGVAGHEEQIARVHVDMKEATDERSDPGCYTKGYWQTLPYQSQCSPNAPEHLSRRKSISAIIHPAISLSTSYVSKANEILEKRSGRTIRRAQFRSHNTCSRRLGRWILIATCCPLRNRAARICASEPAPIGEGSAHVPGSTAMPAHRNPVIPKRIDGLVGHDSHTGFARRWRNQPHPAAPPHQVVRGEVTISSNPAAPMPANSHFSDIDPAVDSPLGGAGQMTVGAHQPEFGLEKSDAGRARRSPTGPNTCGSRYCSDDGR